MQREPPAQRAVDELRGEATDATYDPLLAANSMIGEHVIKIGGLYMLAVDENGNDYCPVCEFCKHVAPPPAGHRYSDNESYMIDGPADACLEYVEVLTGALCISGGHVSRRRVRNIRTKAPVLTKLPPQPSNIEQLAAHVDRTSAEYERHQTTPRWKAFVAAMKKYNEACRAAFDEMERAHG